MVNIRSFLKYSGVKKSPFRFLFINLLKNTGLLGYLKQDTILEYHNGSCALIWDPKAKKLRGTSVYIPKEELSLEKISFISGKRNLISDFVDNNASIRKNMFYTSETYSDFETAVKDVKEIDVLNLGVRFTVKKTAQGLKYLITNASKESNFGIKLTEASSGTQNLVPMNVIVEYYSKYYNLVASINNAILSYVSKSDNLSDFKAVKNVGEFTNKNVHLIIEEPELSLYPSSQKLLMDFLIQNVYGDKEREYNISLMMATHSPYIINYLNVLLSRGRNKIKEEPTAIKENDISVLRVYHGRIQNLISVDSKNGKTLVNTMDLGEEMDDIYNEYMSLNK
nr:ATP-binding protein [Prevotella sp.]